MLQKLVLSCLALASFSALAAAPAPAVSAAPAAIDINVATAWAKQQQALDKAADPRVINSLRAHTKLHVEVEQAPGARVNIDLTGERLLQYMKQNQSKRAEQNKLLDVQPTCNWYADAKNGTVVETCTLAMNYKQRVPAELPRAMYSYSVIAQDKAGLYYLEGWVSTRKLF